MPYTHLISAAELAKFSADRIIVDCRFSLAEPSLGRQQYAQDHIAGAYYLDLEQDLSGEVTATTGRHPLPRVDDFQSALRTIGVQPSSQIVAYDEGAGAFAARLWWLCQWLGHEKVAVLDGGLAAWRALSLPMETTVNEVAALRGAFSAQPKPTMLVDAAAVEGSLAEGAMRLVDARAQQRFSGAQEPIDAVAGHIPGAFNLPFDQNLDEHGYFLPAEILAQRHAGGENSVHMCGSGVTACHNILASVHAGLPIPRLYAGSWSEWIRDPQRPVEREIGRPT